jgi:lysophospholipase L1-like esterase
LRGQATSSRELSARLLLGAASLAVGLLIFEFGLRALGFTPARLRSRPRVLGLEQPLLLDCYPTNPRGYFPIDLRLPPMRARYRELIAGAPFDVAHAPWAIESRFNSQGFRDVEFEPKRPGTTRVIVLGDSFTEGQGVQERDTYPRVLEAMLNSAPGSRYEVRNAGRRGADFPALLQTFEDVLRYDPDVVVYGMVLNDVERDSSLDRRYPALNDWIIDRRARLAGSEPEPPLSSLWAFCSDRIGSLRVSRQATRWYRDMFDDSNAQGWRRTKRHLQRMDAEMRRRGGRFLVALWPLLVSLDAGYPFAGVHQSVAEACRQQGIPLLDLLQALRAEPTASLWVHETDRHPNERAQRLAAASIRGALLEPRPAAR